MSQFEGALRAAQDWLQGYASSPHTQRKYESQLQQFCEWMLVRGYNFEIVDTAEVEQYLADIAQGRAVVDVRDAGRPRSQRTLDLTRSVLRSLFHELVRQGHCRYNPVDFVTRAKAEPNGNHGPAPGLPAWLAVRESMLMRARADGTPRSALRRALAVAELAYWAGLRRSELAAAVMGDFLHIDKAWCLNLRRFGRGREDLVEVPMPAMDSLAEYRASRGLSRWPQPSENTVPLIARLRSEQPVEPWTIANTLKQLVTSAGAGAQAKPPAILDLRKELVAVALEAQVPPQDLARHVRSRNVVLQLLGSSTGRRVGASLAGLAA